MEDSYLGMLHADHYSEYNYNGSQVYVPATSPGPSTVQFVHPYVNRPNTHPYANRRLHVQATGLLELNELKEEKNKNTSNNMPRQQIRSKRLETTPMMFDFRVTDTLWLTNNLLFLSAPTIDKLKIW